MTAYDLGLASVGEVSARYRAHELSPVELVDALLVRIDETDPLINAYLTVLADDLRREARAAERALMRGAPLGRLHGIPVSIKDNIATAGVRTTAGSRVLRSWVPDRDAVCVSRLREEGALIAGKTNLFEFAFGEAHPDYGHVRNPWQLDRSTAGSSTGSVASVAAGLCLGSLGTDTGGSIRVPAAMCGVVGLKPTYGRVARAGVISTALSLCHVGPIARTVEDTARVFDALTGAESASSLDAGVRGLVLAVAASQHDELIEPEVRAAFEDACQVLRSAGAVLREVGLPDLHIARAVLWVVASVEAADLHRERLARHSVDYHPVVRARLEGGTAIPGIAYVRAQRVRRWLCREVAEALRDAAALLLPVAPITAYPLGARSVTIAGHEEDVGQAVTRYTPLASVTGRPAITVPCGLSADRLPVGIQIVGQPGDDATVLRIARAYERTAGWRPQLPDGIKAGGDRASGRQGGRDEASIRRAPPQASGSDA